MRSVITAVSVAVAALATWFVTSAPLAAHPRNGRTGAQQLRDPDHRVCRGPQPAGYHYWGNFVPAVDGYTVLLYTRTAGPRHADLGPALAPGLDPPLTASNVVHNAIIALGAARPC